ncbi:unnamed protein product [Macrosiphum euphorbiae]|uniref:Uncharacterized protein n=2 Tax=Macrosiphum euphorbiae TaxID=13131 RepID=A0AAV0WF65_9HEMI|nr:unnamed protein product [Macrosiphum euphorbiae]
MTGVMRGTFTSSNDASRQSHIYAQLPNVTKHAWTDSTLVLSWLTTTPTTFKMFVSNRLAKIAVAIGTMFHRGENPADCVSRGLLPSQAVSMSLYWNGPIFLQSGENTWPINTYVKLSLSSLPEVKNIDAEISVLTTLSTLTDDQLIYNLGRFLAGSSRLAHWAAPSPHPKFPPGACK